MKISVFNWSGVYRISKLVCALCIFTYLIDGHIAESSERCD